MDPAGWTELGRLHGVRLRAIGEGQSVVVFAGMEGSGESCLHLVLPVVVPNGAAPRGRIVLVDYAEERHQLLGELVTTISELLSSALPRDEAVVLWGQSFGNLLVALVAQQNCVRLRRVVLVSPFTGLPKARVVAGEAALLLAWRPLYRTTTPWVSRLVFGPAPGRSGCAFFRAIARAAPPDIRRRTGWLAGADFASAFLSLPTPVGVWLGERDRLVDLPRQLAFFTALARASGNLLTIIPGSGHVVLPPAAVDHARSTLAHWYTATPSP